MKHNYKVSDLFLVEGTKSLDAGNLSFVEDGINFVGRTDANNGIQGKIDRQDFEPNPANTITATVIGNYKYVKYQSEPYYCSQNINRLTPLFVMDKELALYFCTLIYKFVSNWNGQHGGYKLDQLKDFEVELPVIESNIENHVYTINDINWDDMRNYIISLENECISSLNNYLMNTALS